MIFFQSDGVMPLLFYGQGSCTECSMFFHGTEDMEDGITGRHHGIKLQIEFEMAEKGHVGE